NLGIDLKGKPREGLIGSRVKGAERPANALQSQPCSNVRIINDIGSVIVIDELIAASPSKNGKRHDGKRQGDTELKAVPGYALGRTLAFTGRAIHGTGLGVVAARHNILRLPIFPKKHKRGHPAERLIRLAGGGRSQIGGRAQRTRNRLFSSFFYWH